MEKNGQIVTGLAMIDDVAIQTSKEILTWGPSGVVIILMIALMVFMYRHFLRRETRYETALEAEKNAHMTTIHAHMEDIRDLAKAGEAFRIATERLTSLEATIRLIDERSHR